jgi:transaldolase
VADHGDIRPDQIRPFYGQAKAHLDALAAAGVDYDDVIATLESEGVDKFVASWHELLETVQTSLEEAR